MTDTGTEQDALFDPLFNGLNEQGYLFQEKCCQILQTVRHTGWTVTRSDHPVSLKDQETKIDIVLQRNTPERYAVVECKRADPEYVHWVFGAPGSLVGEADCFLTTIEGWDSGPVKGLEPSASVSWNQVSVRTYRAQNWTEVKKDPKRKVSTSQNIENAFRQVLTGVGGLTQELLSEYRPGTSPLALIPVVITTASLFVAHYDIHDVDITTGTIAKEKVLFGPKGQDPEEVEWVLVDYSVGETLTPEAILEGSEQRSIFVVNADHIQAFFSELMDRL